MTQSWFSVDKAGLGRQAQQQCKGRLIGELVQNALDEAGVTKIDIKLELIPGRPLAALTVEDDAPEGFKDLSHAYTLFADSHKRKNPDQRGQYNFGEKLVLAACQQASVETTTGAVSFNEDGRTEHPRKKRERGSIFWGLLKMNREEHGEVCQYLASLLLPENIVVTFNGVVLAARKAIHVFEASLETLRADEEGVMRTHNRRTQVRLYETLGGETPSLYEMGLPVVETGDKWHINVFQKVPLNRDRDNVRPAYLARIRALVFNEMSHKVTKEEANSVWVQEATSHAECSDKSINRLLDLRFGEKRASYDPSDQEAGKRIQSEGGTVVTGSMLNKEQWALAKEANAIKPAGQVSPTAKPYSTDPNAPAVDVLPREKWTDDIKNVAAYATYLGMELMGVTVTVTIVNTSNNFVACYGSGQLDFNLKRLGYRWFAQGACEEVDKLIIHEFGHQYCGDHLSSDYHEALCLLGARLKNLALSNPEELRRYIR